MQKPLPADCRVHQRRRSRRPKRKNVESRELDGSGLVRFERLKKLRLKLAQAQDVPAFCVAHDSVLLAVAARHRRRLIGSGGDQRHRTCKLDKYGAAFLQAVKG